MPTTLLIVPPPRILDLPTPLYGVNLDRLSPASPIYVQKKINFRLQSRHDLLRGQKIYEIAFKFVLNFPDSNEKLMSCSPIFSKK